MIAGFKQRDAGIKHFKKALQIQPDIQLTKSVATPALQDAFEEAMVGQSAARRRRLGRRRAAGRQRSGRRAAPTTTASGDDAPPPPRRRPPPKKKKKHSDDDDSDDSGAVAKRKGDDDDDDDDDVPAAKNAGKIFVGLSVGGGFGVASGSGEEASATSHALASAGFAPAQLMHIAPEVGYFISQNLMLSLQGRYQIVTGLNPGPNTCPGGCSAKTSAIAVFAKATYVMLDGDFHFFVGGSVGGGAIRHVSNFPADRSCGQA